MHFGLRYDKIQNCGIRKTGEPCQYGDLNHKRCSAAAGKEDAGKNIEYFKEVHINERHYQEYRSCTVKRVCTEGNRERIQIFEGTVIKRQNGGVRETFTVRKNSNGIGVEKTWPLHSPSVENVEVVRRGKVRRAKLYYLRTRVGKAAKVKELVK